jgi:nucleoside-diphosphate-sugar epimerase
MRRVLITGGQGFIGSSVASYFSSKKVHTRISSRKSSNANAIEEFEHCKTSDLSANTDWSEALIGVDVVVHCAGRAHILKDTSVDPLEEFRISNRDGTIKLGIQAAKLGVKRFIFLSSIGVNGAASLKNQPFSELDEPAPHNEYALSKLEAENALFEISRDTGMEVVVIRPPLVYGYAAPGNFALLVQAVRSRLPLPLGGIQNLRSMIFIGNLVDFIFQVAVNPKAANQIFLISDDEDLSIGDVIYKISRAMNMRTFLLPFPLVLLRLLAKCIGAHDKVERLCCTLQIDSSKARKMLGWSPPFSQEEGFSRSFIRTPPNLSKYIY